MALARYIRKKFGIGTRGVTNPVTASCGTSATTLLGNNPDRLGYLLVNLGTTAMHVAWDREVDEDHGVYVAPNGGSFGLIADEDGELVGYELFGKSKTSANDIFIIVTEAA